MIILFYLCRNPFNLTIGEEAVDYAELLFNPSSPHFEQALIEKHRNLQVKVTDNTND